MEHNCDEKRAEMQRDILEQVQDCKDHEIDYLEFLDKLREMATELEITASLNKDKVGERGKIIEEQDKLIKEFRELYGEGNYQAIKSKFDVA